MGIEAAAHICIRRSCGGIQSRHASVADCGDHHGKHCDENDRREVPVGELLRDTVERDRGDGLDENDAIEDKIPEGEDASEVRDLAWGRVAH